jgi:hypothetical protein
MSNAINAAIRFNVHSIQHPKNIAKSIKGTFCELGKPCKLHGAQALVADLFGYADWHDLEKSVNSSLPNGPLDADLSDDLLRERYTRNVNLLIKQGFTPTTARMLNEALSPTGGSGAKTANPSWTINKEGQLETPYQNGSIRIYSGTLNPSLSLAAFSAPRQTLIERLSGDGVSAIVIDGGKPSHIFHVGNDMKVLREEVDEMLRDELAHGHELKLMGRVTVKNDDHTWVVGARNRIVESYTNITDGITLLHTDAYDYLSVDYDQIQQMPEPLRPKVRKEDEGFAFQWSEHGKIIPLLFGDAFTTTEILQAQEYVSSNYPDAYKFLFSDDVLTGADVIKASRGFSTNIYDYHFHSIEETSDGKFTLLATISSYYGPLEEPDIYEQVHMFRISPEDKDRLEYSRMFAQDDYEFIGVHPEIRREAPIRSMI